MKFPMPNDKLDGGIVIASRYRTDDVAEVVLLDPQPPFYRVKRFDLDNGGACSNDEPFENITEVLRLYPPE